MISLIRYPGSKAKLVNQILQRFPAHMKMQLWSTDEWEYREPFFGAGAVGMEVMRVINTSCRVWINDADPAMTALWRTVHAKPKELIRMCGGFTPSVAKFQEFKESDGTGACEVEVAFKKLALHRTSYSGLGAMAGGPIGGIEQSSAYNVSCRWNVQQIQRNVSRLHRLMRRFEGMKITNGDFLPLVTTATAKTFIYLDPPYYEKGGQLYKFNMTDADHVRLRDALMETRGHWVLSYDDHPRVRELYAGCVIEPIYATYTTSKQQGGKRPKNSEVVIYQ